MILAVGFPNPIGWTVDQIGTFVEGTVSAGFESMIGGLVAWVIDAVLWVVGGVFAFFIDSTDPNVQADWFVAGDGPYRTTLGIGAALLVAFLLAGAVQGALAGDAGGMLHRLVVDLPTSVLGMVALVSVTQALIRLTDELSNAVLANFHDDLEQFVTVVGTLSSLGGGTSTALVVFLLGLVTVLAGLILVAELVVRSALIYIVVALAPLVFAARVWPATRGGARRCLDLLVALIVSKLVIAIALAVAAAAAVGAGSGGEVTALPPPEVFAEDPGGSVTQAVGILLAASAAFGVAAFSPLLVTKLLPLTEAAVVAQGIRGGPVRAGHQGLMLANTGQMVTGHRYHQIAAGRASVATGGGAAAGVPAVAAAAAGGPAAAAVPAARGLAGVASTAGGAAAASAGQRSSRNSSQRAGRNETEGRGSDG